MKKFILTVILLLMPINVRAAITDRFSIECDKTSFKEFAEFTCHLSVQTVFVFDKIEFSVKPTEGLYLDDARSNHDALWQVGLKSKKVTSTTKRNQFVDNLQEFGILLLQTVNSGEQKIIINNIVLTNTEKNETRTIDEVSQDITILSSENKLKKITIDKQNIVDFDSQVSVYRLEIDKDQTTVDIEAIPIDETATITGGGPHELDLSLNEFVFPIEVKSASGTNKVYLLYLSREKSLPNTQITAANISLTDNNKKVVKFQFDPHTYDYNIEVDNNIKAIDLVVELPNAGWTLVKNYGSRKITIEDGDNLALVKIIDQNGIIKTYVLNITRVLSNKSANCYLQSLKIEGADLKFNKKVKRYSLVVNKSQKKLDISALADDKKAIVTIIGNENLKDGSIVKILVVAENGSKLTYQINISQKSFNYNSFVIGLTSIAFVLFSAIIYHEFRKRKIAKIKEAIRQAEELAKAEALAKQQAEEAKKAEELAKAEQAKKKKANPAKKPAPSNKNKKPSAPKKKQPASKKTVNTNKQKAKPKVNKPRPVNKASNKKSSN